MVRASLDRRNARRVRLRGRWGRFKGQGTDGTDFDTFAALGASGLSEGDILVGGDEPLESTARKADGTDPQFFLTNPDTFTTEDAFVGIISEDGAALVKRQVSFELSQSGGLDFNAQVLCNLQQFTRTIPGTVSAI